MSVSFITKGTEKPHNPLILLGEVGIRTISDFLSIFGCVKYFYQSGQFSLGQYTLLWADW